MDKISGDKDKVFEEYLKQVAIVKAKVEFHIKQLKQQVEVLKKQRDEALHYRHLLITKGIPRIISILFDSTEFFIPLAKVMQLAFELGRQLSLEVIQRKQFPNIPLEDMEGYDGTVFDRYKQACKEFYEMEYPYLKEIAANADKPFEFIMNIKPKSIPVENMKGYNSNVLDRCRQACKEFARMKFSYIQEIIANALINL